MFFYVYKLTNLVNSKIYIGCHQTKNLDDGYMGSGRRLNYAKRKYGVENFKKEILAFFETAEEMFAEEKKIVDREFLNRTDVYNLQPGGGGGLCNEDHKRKFIMGGYKSMVNSLTQEQRSERTRKAWNSHKNSRLEKLVEYQKLAVEAARSEESKAKRSATFASIGHSQGEKNTQYGTCWVNKDGEYKKIKKEQLDEFLSLGFSKGRAGYSKV